MPDLTKIAKTLSEFDDKVNSIVDKKIEETSKLIDIAENEGRKLEEKRKEIVEEIRLLVSKAKEEEMERIKKQKMEEKQRKLSEIEKKGKENYDKSVEKTFVALMRELQK